MASYNLALHPRMTVPSNTSSHTPGSLSYGQSSDPTIERIRTISHTASSELSGLSADEEVRAHGSGEKAHRNGNGLAVKVRKRSRENTATNGPVKKTKKIRIEGKEVKEKGIYCHQCHNRCEPDEFIRCTKMKQRHRSTPPRPCNLAWCDKDLARRYGIDGNAVRAGAADSADHDEHGSTSGYTFACPCCTDVCQNSVCRKKKGLEPLGIVNRPGYSEAADGRVPSPKKTSAKAKAGFPKPKPQPLNSSTLPTESDSELSDLSSEHHTSLPTKKPRLSKVIVDLNTKHESSKGAPTVQSKVIGAINGSSAQEQNGNGINGKGAVKAQGKTIEGKSKPTGESKGKSKKKETQPKPKKVEVAVEPPVFEKVDTRLSLDEADQRMALREYLNRFRPILSIPERSLGAVDDFDRALTEASVRLFAGAMLDLIKEELVQAQGDEELIELLSHHREELRYYADLARFATTYNTLAIPLGLGLPIPLIRTRLNRDAIAIQAVLDLPDVGPSRRSASRIPHPAEVVRMLLAIADRTIHTPTMRHDLDSTAGENEARRRHASEHKKESTAWEVKKKKLGDARVQCKTPQETKANKDMHTKELKEHNLCLALANVNLRAALSRRAVRHEPLGIDLDGRIYYSLNPRSIDDDARAPTGWASGLLVWGMGVAKGTEELPAVVERWTHFGKSASVKHLIKWIEWRGKKVAEQTKSKPQSTPAKSIVAAPAKSPHSGHPSAKLVQSTLFATKAGTPGRRPTFEIVIPTRKATSSDSSLTDASEESDDGSDTSELSLPPETTEDLLRLVDPTGYTPSAVAVAEENNELIRRLGEVAEWLEVLEWKGMGEMQ